ncbi:MAG TPA: hypothetical protein VMV94_12575 [Phycisphaerae bacterium]|nr:hypothetical protein [Phycisphaerae bacterium]
MNRKNLLTLSSVAITFVSIAVGVYGCSLALIGEGPVVDLAADIVFTRWEEGGSDILLKSTLSADAPDLNLTMLPAARNTEPAWSPDKTLIAFVSDRDGNAEIYTMNRDGTNVVRLTDYTGTDISPSFSPDGSRIAFISYRSGRNRSVFTMRTDGSDVVQVTDNPGTDATPVWSPDSRSILFTSNFETADHSSRLYIVGADGSNQHRLTSDTVDEAEPDWHPGTSRIVYERSDAQGGSQIYSVNADGSGLVRLTDGLPEHEGWHATWSPDGTRIAFVSGRDGNPQLYVMTSEGTDVMRITQTPDIDGQPCWGIND